ncbi:MAG: threonine-phosphate decarboxylase CobD [Halocynthiibacter sp.]
MAKRDHGGNMDEAIAQYGGTARDWIDLSTGINRVPYPVPNMPEDMWTALPTKSLIETTKSAARKAYGTRAPMLVTAGAQGAIQMLPRHLPMSEMRVLAPTYNEHAASFKNAGWPVKEVATLSDLEGADVAIIVNPNNPDGQIFTRDTVLKLAKTVGHLIVDESFADPYPSHSVAPEAGRDGLIVLRSFGKFYGLAGVRLGFILGAAELIADLQDMAGPWPVAGNALFIGAAALNDASWAKTTITRLQSDVTRCDTIAHAAGWSCVGGSLLFRLYETPDATAAQIALAKSHIWSRIFPYSDRWIRLGLPADEAEFSRLEIALTP